MTKLRFYNEEEDLTVGSYSPSDQFSDFTHFAVMGASSTALIGLTGYFQNIHSPSMWSWKDYLDAAENIEQAQLYSNALGMFNMINLLLEDDSEENKAKAKELLGKIVDISEPVERLLGKGKMKVVEEALKKSQK